MGIPKFFRWLTRRYPMILENVQKEEDLVPIDNLYLDLNGIVHNCVHGNDPKRHERISRLEDMEELWAAIIQAIDEVVHLVKPKKNIFLAVDGVAPRAKMNQQRARRFKSARERALLKAQIEARGKQMPELFDSNAISPGTKFMGDLCKQLHFMIKYKLNSDPLYMNLESCVLSDGTVPGEGEHKMLDYIRQQRRKPNYDPNTRHCFYGADADLIMLSLLTHEPHFTIIREEHVVKRQKNGGVQRVELSHTNNFQLIHISLLREYMMLEYKQLNGKLRFRFDIERIIDDFVFFCFFIGNDFLPALSALDIAEGSLDKLIEFYKNFLPTLDDYITNAGVIHWDRAEKFIELLGSHENQVFKGRIDEINYKSKGRGNHRGRGQDMTKTVTVSAEAAMLLEGEAGGDIGGGVSTQNMYKSAIFAKKQAKVNKYQITQGGKKYKKYLISKKFREDDENTQSSKLAQQTKDTLNAKLQAYYTAQQSAKAAAQTEGEAAEESKQELKTGLELIEEIDESYLSDLKPEDIPDDCVSEPDMQSLEANASSTIDGAKSNLMTAQADIDARAEEDNRKFIQEFVTLYAEDPDLAKKKYYSEKVSIDIDTDEGQDKKRCMMKKYLEGLQWVLFYYYKGCCHWRWYYPFHYAPMISDLGSNIVKDFLSSKTVISEFEVDFNCPAKSEPYTPFQQLLCIMPLKSIKLLPTCYEPIARGDLVDFFPEDFGIDLNGKTVAWEALVLIPFADETLFIQKEAEMFGQNTNSLNEEETMRNQSSFTFFSYKYDLQAPAKPLTSTLTSLLDLPSDKSNLTIETEYGNVGTEAFTPKILPRVKLPSPGYPTFKTLGVIELKIDYVYVQKQQFEKFMVVIPQCIEETQPEELEKYLMKLTKQNKKDVFVDFPHQNEAFPMSFEDQFTVYTLFGDYYENKYTIQMSDQTRDQRAWETHVNRIRYKIEEKGIYCPIDKLNVLVSCYKVADVNFNTDYEDQYFFKTYNESSTILPLSLMMRVRSPEHYLNVDIRTISPDDEIKQGAALIACKPNIYGLIGHCLSRDRRSGNIKVTFDKTKEQQKVQDPFMGQKAIEQYQKANAAAVNRAQSYYGENEIDVMLQMPQGVCATMTSSFMIKYTNPETRDRVLVDIGLNIKSWAKKQHVPGFVRFAIKQGDLAVNQIDQFTDQKQYQKERRHVRPHWQYSVALVDILREYKEKFPEVFENALDTRKKDRMPEIKDIFGSNDPNAIGKLKAVSVWIESLSVSSLPFVDMGFDTLEKDMIDTISDQRKNIVENYNNVNLQVRATEFIPSKFLYMERFPFWSSAFPENKADKFKVGDRVLNLNSMKRAYVPFGARGTVVGKTEAKIIVMFDEQFLQGTDINGLCELYRGAIIEPTYVMNITRKFESQIKKFNNKALINSFTERPLGQEQPEAPTDNSQGGNNASGGRQQQAQRPANQDQPPSDQALSNNDSQQKQLTEADGQEESKGQKRQYRMKSNQQEAYDQGNQEASRGRGRGRGRGGRGDGSQNQGGRGDRRGGGQNQGGRGEGRGGGRGESRGGNRGEGRGGSRGDKRGGGENRQRNNQNQPAVAQQDTTGISQPIAQPEQVPQIEVVPQVNVKVAPQQAAKDNEPEYVPKVVFKPMSDLSELMSLVNVDDKVPSLKASTSHGIPAGNQMDQPPLQTIVSENPAAAQNPSTPLMSQNMVSLESKPFMPVQADCNPEENKQTDQQ